MSGRIFVRYPIRVNGQSQGEPRANKRLAIRECRHLLQQAGDGATGSVRSGAAGGPLIWQAHNRAGRIVVEEL
jgi:hypothetical protein